jgi:hypothetical protein
LKKTDQIRIKISPDLKKKFRTQCENRCVNMSKLIIKWICKYVEDENEK